MQRLSGMRRCLDLNMGFPSVVQARRKLPALCGPALVVPNKIVENECDEGVFLRGGVSNIWVNNK
jgi:hypothetical protein